MEEEKVGNVLFNILLISLTFTYSNKQSFVRIQPFSFIHMFSATFMLPLIELLQQNHVDYKVKIFTVCALDSKENKPVSPKGNQL